MSFRSHEPTGNAPLEPNSGSTVAIAASHGPADEYGGHGDDDSNETNPLTEIHVISLLYGSHAAGSTAAGPDPVDWPRRRSPVARAIETPGVGSCERRPRLQL